MRVVRHLTSGSPPFRSPIVALGNFDGVHLGHRAIIARLIEQARAASGDAVVFTFHPHPIAVLAPERAPAMITSLAQRLARVRELGPEGVVLRRFTREFASTAAEDFVREILVRDLGATGVVVGYNVSFGRDRLGTPELLERMGRELGFAVEIIPPVVVGERQVSSSAIRRALTEGQVEVAAELLGRPHLLLGRVRRGARRGATIGFPTANVFPRGGMLPADGVYAVRAAIDPNEPSAARGGAAPSWLPGVANLGLNPTFGLERRQLEVHLFDYDADLYGRVMRVELHARLRGEVKFVSVDALVEQIRADAKRARELLAAAP